MLQGAKKASRDEDLGDDEEEGSEEESDEEQEGDAAFIDDAAGALVMWYLSVLSLISGLSTMGVSSKVHAYLLHA